MSVLTASERKTVAELRASYAICRSCRVKMKAAPGEACPQCGSGLQRPMAPYQDAFPTIAFSPVSAPAQATVAATRVGGNRFPDASTSGRCIYCFIEGDGMLGEGLQKRCADEVACAERVREKREGAAPRPALSVVRDGRMPAAQTASTPAQIVIEMLQRKANIAALDGPLDYGVDARFPIEAAQARQVIFGKSGSGKTHANAVIVESNIAAGVPVCAIDKLGRLWGLRAAGRGGSGIPIPILGGVHGDLPIDYTDGARVAAIFAQGISMLVDVSLMSSDEQQEFATDFFREALRVLRIPSHVLLEEADAFCPAFSRGKAQFASQGATTMFCRQIRNFGVGWTLSTQRQRLLHPDAVETSNVFIAMQSTGDKAHRSIHAEARTRLGRPVADAILAEIGQLPRGEAWLMPDPDWLGGDCSAPIRMRFRDRRTYDSTAVPRIGQPLPPVPDLVAVDLRPFKSLREDDGGNASSAKPFKIEKPKNRAQRRR